MKGIDCSTPITPTTAKALAASGVEFACRYLVPARYAWKRLTRQEAEAITAAGLKIISVFETSANRVTGGAAAGQADGSAAYQEARVIGQPPGSAIYFAVDFDAQPTDYNAIEAYLKAAATQIPGYDVGVYGSYAVVEEMARRGAAKHFWQTYAWSGGKKSNHANVYQYKNDQTMAGIQVDLDESYGGEGWWSTKIEEAVTAMFTDIVGHWAQGNIEHLAQIGVVSGKGDGKFDPNSPITRAEAAVIVDRAISYVMAQLKGK